MTTHDITLEKLSNSKWSRVSHANIYIVVKVRTALTPLQIVDTLGPRAASPMGQCDRAPPFSTRLPCGGLYKRVCISLRIVASCSDDVVQGVLVVISRSGHLMQKPSRHMSEQVRSSQSA